MATKKKKKTTKKKSIKKNILKITIGFFLLMILLGGALLGSVYLGLWGKLPTKEELANLNQIQASQVFDTHQQLIGKYFVTDREAIAFEDLPEDLIHALIATEDARFYEHHGVDRQSLMRVLFKSILLQDKSSGGGSTITLQLAKNLYGRKSYPILSMAVNKLKEGFIAKRLEKVYSKNEILTLYLNTVPFPGDTYGVESASQKFFGIKTRNLSLSQAATLVGSLKANHSYNPRLFPERSQLRRDVVLTQMLKYGYLTADQATRAMDQKLKIDYKNYSGSNGPAPYFVEKVRKEVEHILQSGKYKKPDGSVYNLKTDGLKIYTTLDYKMQQYAEASMRSHMTKLQAAFEKSFGNNPPWRAQSAIVQTAVKQLPTYKKLKSKGWKEENILDSLGKAKETELFDWQKNEVKSVSAIDSLRHYLKFLNAGMLAVDPHTGAIKAYVGGIDYRYFQYDHVSQSKRQVGSTFKPFVYTAAFENGLEPCDYLPVREVTYTDHHNWTPKNAGSDIDPDLNYSLAEALTQSLNTISVKVLRQTGIQNVIRQVHQLGIEEEIVQQPSIALGVSNLRIWDMATAYTAYLNKGIPKRPYFLQRIEDKHGNLIVEFLPQADLPKAMNEKTRQEMIEILKNVVNRGTGQRLRSVYGLNNAIAGKTGTTQDNTDGWFVGLLPDLVTVTWVGNDNPKIKFPSTYLGQGANSALPIFAGMLQKLNNDADYYKLTRAQFPIPSTDVLIAMGCEPTQKDGFLDRLFKRKQMDKEFDKSPKKVKRKQKTKQKKKKGFFQRLFGGGK